MEKQVCYVCKKEYPLVEFRKEKRNPSGYTELCKQCHSKRNIEYVKKDSATHNKITKRYHQTER